MASFVRALVLLLLTALVAGAVSLPLAIAARRTLPSIRSLLDPPLPDPRPSAETTFVYDRAGKLIARFHATVDRVSIPLDQMPKSFRRAVIAIEDARFYRHDGISYPAILRAALTDLVAGDLEQGGSTITQQWVKNAYTSGERTLARKFREAMFARKLERRLSKDEILERYLNTVYLGNGAYGVEAAARRYFGIPARKLSLLQAATLAGMIRAPSRLDPVDHPKRTRARRNVVLTRMADLDFISPRRAEKLRAKPAVKVRADARVGIRFPYFLQHVRKQLVRRYGSERTFAGGLRVTTSLDSRMQRAALRAVEHHLPDGKGPSAALVAIDPRTGHVRALVGGKDFERQKFNLATQARRQAGSTFKVFTLAAALRDGVPMRSVWKAPADLTVEDDRCRTAGRPWKVENYGGQGAGRVTLLAATARSINTVFAQVVMRVGPDRVAKLARKMGIRAKLAPVCSITLGSQGVSPLGMASGYATLAARGVRHKPVALLEVADSSGESVDRHDRRGRRVLPRRVADRVTHALRRVVLAGTGRAASLGSRPAAGKTGTAQNHVDAWFCGYVPQLAACVWVGHRKGEIPLADVGGVARVTGGSLPAAIWRDFMRKAVDRMPVKSFPEVTLRKVERRARRVATRRPAGRAEEPGSPEPPGRKRRKSASSPPPASTPPPIVELPLEA